MKAWRCDPSASFTHSADTIWSHGPRRAAIARTDAGCKFFDFCLRLLYRRIVRMTLSSKLLQTTAVRRCMLRQAHAIMFVKACFQCLLLTLFCMGCVQSSSVSGHKEYRPYIRQTVKLTRPMLLVGCHSSLFSTDGVRTLGYARYALTEQERAWAPGPLFAKLPQGYSATIDSVHEEITGDSAVYVVYGHIVNPASGERASFAYVHYPSWDPLPWRLASTNP